MSTFRADIFRSLPIALAALLASCLPAELRDQHATAIESYSRTPFVTEDQPFAQPERALGPPDGRTVALGTGAFIVLRFFREIRDGSGPDLRVYELGPDGSQARIAVSVDGAEFWELSEMAEGPATELDLAPTGLAQAFFVRVRGVDDLGLEPGFDLDAVEALH